MTPEDVLRFWFTDHGMQDWFAKNDAFDKQVREKFGETYEAAREGKLKDWRVTPRGRLAEVLVLDQFPRNMFRGTPRAFESDTEALECADAAIAADVDR